MAVGEYGVDGFVRVAAPYGVFFTAGEDGVILDPLSVDRQAGEVKDFLPKWIIKIRRARITSASPAYQGVSAVTEQ